MLTIRNEQMSVFRAALRQQLVQRLAAQARAEHPAEVAAYADPALEERIDEGLRRALSLGRVVLAEQMRFAVLHAAGIAAPGEAQSGEGACR